MAGILDSFLGSLGQGMQNAGGILSPQVYENQVDQQKQLSVMRQRQAEQAARSLQQAVQTGSITPDQYRQGIQQLGQQFQALQGIGPSPQAIAAQQGNAMDARLLSGMGQGQQQQQQPQQQPGMLPSPMSGQMSGQGPTPQQGAAPSGLGSLPSQNPADYMGPLGGRMLQNAGAMSQIASRGDTLQFRKDQLQQNMEAKQEALQQRADAAAQHSEDFRLSVDQRRQAAEENAQIRRALIGMQADARRQGIDLRQQQYQDKKEAVKEKAAAPIQDIIGQIDGAIKMMDANPDIVGGKGKYLTRPMEFIQSSIDPTADTPASTFQSQMVGIKSAWRKLPTVGANRFKSDVADIDNAVKGLGTFTSYKQSRDALINLRENLSSGLERRGVADSKPVAPAVQSKEERDSLPPGSHYTYNGKTYVKGQ